MGKSVLYVLKGGMPPADALQTGADDAGSPALLKPQGIAARLVPLDPPLTAGIATVSSRAIANAAVRSREYVARSL
jgi:hypothetical protein